MSILQAQLANTQDFTKATKSDNNRQEINASLFSKSDFNKTLLASVVASSDNCSRQDMGKPKRDSEKKIVELTEKERMALLGKIRMVASKLG